MSSHVKVGVFDLDGILRGKYLSRDKFESAAQSGLGFCDVIFGWDCADVVYDNVRFTGGLGTALKAGDQISIIPAIAGGSPGA